MADDTMPRAGGAWQHPCLSLHASGRESEGTGTRQMKEPKASVVLGLGEPMASVFTANAPVRVEVPCPK